MKPGLGTRDSGPGDSWRPSASLQTLKARAELFGSVRAFFAARGVMEVDTPMLSQHATVDRHIESFAVAPPASHLPPPGCWLHTSPEFAMKRLLAAGSGPIYQICHVFRREESGRHHNPEFTMLEWYRPGFDHHALMDEVEALLAATARPPQAPERISYRSAFERHAGFDPHGAPLEVLARIEAPASATAAERADRDFWLNLWMGAVVSPRLGIGRPCFVFDFPASQAALSQVRPGEPPLAERFELFWEGLELANGFHELLDPVEQLRRFEADQAWRAAQGLVVPPHDRQLIDALRAGLPACAGVALGLDRLLMLARGLPDVASAMSFAADRA